MLINSDTIKQWSAEYAQCFCGLRYFMTRYRPAISPIDVLVDLANYGSILDIGCGNALFPYLLWRAGKSKDITGVELSHTVVEATNSALAKADAASNIKVIQADNPSNWPDITYNMVSAIDVMHHVPPAHQEVFFKEMCRRVKPGGLLLYKDMCRKPLWRALANRLHDLILAQQIIHYLPVEKLEEWAARANLKIVHAATINLLWYGHELRVFMKS